MNPTVFISHSCKDKEKAPPDGLSAAEAAARQERLKFARDLRADVHARLKAVAGLDVFLDVRGGLGAGDVWQDGLHQALRTCSGAVILLSPEALESGWVLKEATILSWRVFMSERLIVVPVMLGVSRADLRAKGFGAVDLDAIQWVQVPAASPGARTAAVDEIVAALAPVAAAGVRNDKTTWKTKVERWLLEFGNQLKKEVPEGYDEDYLKLMYQALGVEAQDRNRDGEDPYQDVSAFLLASKTRKIIKMLRKVPTSGKSQRQEIQNKVRPFWVDPLAATPLPHAAREGMVVAIDGEEVESARDYVRRAYCTFEEVDHLLAPPEVTDGTAEQIVSKVRAEVGRYYDPDNAKDLAEEIEDCGPIYVILGPGSAREDVLDQLTAAYPQLTFVAVTGADPKKRLGKWHGRALLLAPSLQPGKEGAGRRFRNRIQAFVDGTT
ncbi:MAG: toll/interleukin-1 receptor domain-containing protein [bacterium]|nr:toll/interleukin-1 receptor domain-containing protein [bacterium]